MGLLPPYSICSLLRLMRQFAGMSQVELASKLGVTQSWLSKLESGTGELGLSQLLALREVFGISADSLIDGAVPFDLIARRYGQSLALPSSFSRGGTPMRHAYPMIHLLCQARGDAWVTARLRQLGVQPHAVADPRLPIHRSFHVQLLELCESEGLLRDERAWKNLAENFNWVEPALKKTADPLEVLKGAIDQLGDCDVRVKAKSPSAVELRAACSEAGDRLYWKYLTHVVQAFMGPRVPSGLRTEIAPCPGTGQDCVAQFSWA